MYHYGVVACREGLVHKAAKILGCDKYITSICQAVIDRHNIPRTFLHREIFDLPTPPESVNAPLLINGRPEVISVLNSPSVALNLSAGNYGLRNGDELALLNLSSLSQTVDLVISVGEGIRFTGISALAGTVAVLTINAADMCAFDLTEYVELRQVRLHNMPGLRFVNVSGLKQLAVLELVGCAGVTDINAAGCEELREMLGAEDLPRLSSLDLGSARIRDLDLSNSREMQYLSIPEEMQNLVLGRREGVSIVRSAPRQITAPPEQQ
jgi:hypothetical protein